MMNKLVSIIIIAGGMLTCLTALHAQSWTWNGDGVSWGDGSNWSTNSVPSSSGIVSIEDATVVIGDQYIIQQLNLDEVILTINENSGLIIKGATSTALDIVESEVNINGILSIRNYSNSGIRMDIISAVMVSTTGLIRINAAGNIGIEIQEGALVNAGDVRIEDPSTGILNYDRINNRGSLLIDGVQVIGIDHREGSLQNCGGGVLEIVGDTTITTNVIGIDMGGGIKNDGTIIVSSCNHYSFRFRRDTLINNDSLIIRNYRFGIFAGITSGNSLIQKNAAGVILFKNPNLSNPTMGLRTTGTLNNYGLIKFVGQCQNGVFIDGPTGVFNNYGKLESADTWNGLFLTNQSTVINHVGGVMDIISDGDADYGIHNSDSLVNDGSIFIELPPHSESCIA